MSCQSQCDNLKAKFNALDKDGNGSLSKTELKANLSSLGISEAQFDAFYKSADKNADDKITLEELTCYFSKHGKK